MSARFARNVFSFFLLKIKKLLLFLANRSLARGPSLLGRRICSRIGLRSSTLPRAPAKRKGTNARSTSPESTGARRVILTPSVIATRASVRSASARSAIAHLLEELAHLRDLTNNDVVLLFIESLFFFGELDIILEFLDLVLMPDPRILQLLLCIS